MIVTLMCANIAKSFQKFDGKLVNSRRKESMVEWKLPHCVCSATLEEKYNEEGVKSVLDSLQVAEAKNEKFNEEATEKVEQFHVHLGAEDIIKKRKGNRIKHSKKKYYQHYRIWIFFSPIDNYLIHCSSHPAFIMFRSDTFMQILRTISGENDIRTLTMLHLK